METGRDSGEVRAGLVGVVGAGAGAEAAGGVVVGVAVLVGMAVVVGVVVGVDESVVESGTEGQAEWDRSDRRECCHRSVAVVGAVVVA